MVAQTYDTFFNPSRPLYVKIDKLHVGAEKDGSPKYINRGEYFNWQGRGIDQDKIYTMFLHDMLYHDASKEVATHEKAHGDGLESMSIDDLHRFLHGMNAKIKEKSKHNNEFARKKIPLSTIKDKQIGLIRRWRTTYGAEFEG